LAAGQCTEACTAGHNLCERHLREEVRYRSVQHVSHDSVVVVTCDKVRSDGSRCHREAVIVDSGSPPRAYCPKHARSAAIAKGAPRHCIYEKRSGSRCGREASLVRSENRYIAYCWKHLDAAETERERCRALTAAGNRCRNPVASDHEELCASHNHAAGTVHHYATSDLVYT
jgi:hypothetical protein